MPIQSRIRSSMLLVSALAQAGFEADWPDRCRRGYGHRFHRMHRTFPDHRKIFREYRKQHEWEHIAFALNHNFRWSYHKFLKYSIIRKFTATEFHEFLEHLFPFKRKVHVNQIFPIVCRIKSSWRFQRWTFLFRKRKKCFFQFCFYYFSRHPHNSCRFWWSHSIWENCLWFVISFCSLCTFCFYRISVRNASAIPLKL